MQLDFLLYIRGSFEKEPMQLQQLQYYGGLFFMILATNYLMAYTRATPGPDQYATKPLWPYP